MNTSPVPWSRYEFTQPASVTVSPEWSRRSSLQWWVRRYVAGLSTVGVVI